MKQRKSKMLIGTLAASIVFGGSFAGTIHHAYAADATAGQNATAAATASQDTIAGLDIPVFAKLRGVDLRLGKAALSTAIILSEDLQDVYIELSSGKSLSQIGSKGASDYTSQLIGFTQSNIDAAVAKGNITSAQGSQLSSYAARILNQEINDANYRDNDNSSGDPVSATTLSVNAASADIAQFLGLPQDDLTAALQSGKSLGAIAQEKGIGEDKLVAKLQEGLAVELKQIIWNTPAPAAAPSTTGSSDTTGTTGSY